MRRPGDSSAAQGSLARRMDQLRATWNQKLEKEARDSDTRERVLHASLELNFHRLKYAPLRTANLRPQASQKQKQGRKEQRPHDFTSLAGSLWKQKKGRTGRVSHNDLMTIAGELDSRKFVPPAKYLEGKAAKELKGRNSKNANSKSGGAIRTWSVLVTRADEDDLRATRRLLIRCASKQP